VKVPQSWKNLPSPLNEPDARVPKGMIKTSEKLDANSRILNQKLYSRWRYRNEIVEITEKHVWICGAVKQPKKGGHYGKA
jgi:hypothetical protein